jgi:hypothetical protein
MGGVGVDEEQRRFGPVNGAIEIGVNIDDEQKLDLWQCAFGLRFRARIEILSPLEASAKGGSSNFPFEPSELHSQMQLGWDFGV